MKKTAAFVLAVVMSILGAVSVQALEAAGPATTSSYQVTVYFTQEGLALKYGPGEESGTYLVIPEGTSLHIDQVSNGWGMVTYNGITGWVSLKYTRITGDYPTPQPYSGQITPVYKTVEGTEGEGLELRNAPTADTSTFGPLYDGTVFKAVAQSGEWVYGEHNGHYGWCNTYYLRDSSPSEIDAYEASRTTQAQPETSAQPAPVVRVPEGLPADNGYAQAYMDILNSDREGILLYDWQKSAEPTRAVALSNIYGNETPELIYISAGWQEDSPYAMPQLHIVTFENLVAEPLFDSYWGQPAEAGGYSFYYLFRMAGKPALYLYQDAGDDFGRMTYGRLDPAGDGTMAITELFRHTYSAFGDAADAYFQKGEAITAEQYREKIDQAETTTTDILMYTDGCGDFVDQYVAQNGSSAMTLEEALFALGSLITDDDAPAEEPGQAHLSFD